MKKLTVIEESQSQTYIIAAITAAYSSTCQRSRCGTVIVRDGEIIGAGYNSPPADREGERRCTVEKDSYHKKVTDKTCCMHAEERAIMDALRRHPDKLAGSRLYFIRLDESGKPARAGKPYCTICSKMALDAGVAEFVLWHDDGVWVYLTDEYNAMSFHYQENNIK